MCYSVSGMHIKESLLLIGKSSPCGGSGFPPSLSERSDTMSDVNKMLSASFHSLEEFKHLNLINHMKHLFSHFMQVCIYNMKWCLKIQQFVDFPG